MCAGPGASLCVFHRIQTRAEQPAAAPGRASGTARGAEWGVGAPREPREPRLRRRACAAQAADAHTEPAAVSSSLYSALKNIFTQCQYLKIGEMPIKIRILSFS